MFRTSFLGKAVSSVQSALHDLLWVLAATACGMLLQAGELAVAGSLTGVYAVSLSAGLFAMKAQVEFRKRQPTIDALQFGARVAFTLALVLPALYVLLNLLPAELPSRQAMEWSALIATGAVVVRRAYKSRGEATPRTGTRVVIFGAGAVAADIGRTLLQADPNINIIGYIPGPNEREPAVPANELLARDGSLCELARRHVADEIVVALTERRAGSMPLRELLDCKLSGVKVYDISTHFEKTLGQISIDYLNAGWLVFGDGFNQGVVRTAVKRAFDILCALLLLLVSAPVMLLAALLIKLESKGPMLYRQERVGLNGSTFDVVKFRSMRTDAEKDGKPRWATSNDDRVTRIGRFIRKTRIDELPQLFNVLSGEMSLVGPRPERPFFVEQLTQEIPYFAVRHSVKPGVTGWAQVRYPYGATVEDSQRKLQFDLYYVKNHSLWLDLLILVETVVVVLTARGAR